MNPEFRAVDDVTLNSAGQQMVREMVRVLPDETVSMSWRSSLNEQLLVVAAKQKKKRQILWFARPALGVSFASALAFVVLFHPATHKPVTVPDSGIEQAILTDHHSSAMFSEVSNTGLNLIEVTTGANDYDPEDGQWNEADVESL